MPKIRIFTQIYHAIPQKNRRILLISNLQENFRKIASVERNDETRDFLVNKILAVALMSQRQPFERSRNRSVNSPIGALPNTHGGSQKKKLSKLTHRFQSNWLLK